MRWTRSGDTSDVIDARGASGGGGGFPGGRVALPGGLGAGGLIIYLLISLLGGGSGGFNVAPGFGDTVNAPVQNQPIPASQDPDKDLKDFSIYVFHRVQSTWEQTFQKEGKPYEHAKLVLYRHGVDTACGSATSAVGPFYCPGDKRVYLDLSFQEDMKSQLGASGDFAWAYVIAHEMGHHVQEELGTEAQVAKLRQQDPGQANALSVRVELQADCYAGVWAKSAFADLQDGDLEEAFNAAQAVGDDRLQKQATGTVRPDTFTHGTSAQRLKWFKAGETGGSCDTFGVDSV
jgi:predicted metalloprotease